MPLTARTAARRRRRNPDEKLPERPGESSAEVMAPTRMKLRVRRRDDAAGGGGQPEEEEETRRESRSSSRRKNTNNTSTTAAASSSSPPSSSSSSASARAAMAAAEEASPDSKCPICLDRFNNLAYLDRCLHRFCFPCIQEWSHNKAECPLCKQPFASILHSVRAEDDFKEYTLRPAPANSSVAATVAMVAAMASAARNDHQMRLMLRRHRGADGAETTSRRRRRDRGGRGGGARRGGVWEWYLDSPPLTLHPLPRHPPISPVVAEDSEEGEPLDDQRTRGGADLAERGVIFEGLTGLGGAGAPVAPNDRATRRLMTRLAARQRLQREGGTVRRLRERETVTFRRALYRSGIRVSGVAGVTGNQGQQQQRDITAENFRRNPVHLNRLRPWLRRELTVLYGAHGSLVDIVQRIIMARLARHGLEDTPTIEEELRPFLLARTDHFLHELVSFARSPLSLENYDLQAAYEPPAAALDLDGTSSSSESSSVIAISEGEDEDRQTGGRSEERPLGGAGGDHDDVIQTGSCLSLSAWDDETPGPSYSSAEPSCSLASLPFSPQSAANEEGGEKQGEGGDEEECLIVGYKKPIAERTPELVQLSSDTEEEEEEKKKKEEEPPSLPATTPPLSYLPTIPPSTSGAFVDEPDGRPKEKDGESAGRRSRERSWSGSSGRSRNSVSPATPGESWRDGKPSGVEAAKEKRRRKRSRRERERSGDRLRKSGTLYNPNRSIYPAMMRHRSHSPSPFNSSVESGSPLPPSPTDSDWEFHCSQVSPLTSSVSSPSRCSSSSSPVCSSPQPSSQTPPTPTLSPGDRGGSHHGEKPGGKRKYKSRHLDSDDKDPTWRPVSSHRRERRRERREKERRKRGRRERHRRDAGDSSSSRRCRDDRSPSVEIIYEGTITSSTTQPPARKRRRKRPRRTQHSSSPVIITLDSDSSHDDANNKNNPRSSSSSPLSSQKTVDFSDLPPLPLVHSAGVGETLNAEIGELPVDILDRGSGSETEPMGPSEAAGPIAIDNSDNSDRDVDVENVEESSSVPGLVGDKGPADSKENSAACQRQTGTVDEVNDAPTTTDHKTGSEVCTSERRLLATILNDLKGITAPQSDLSLNFEPNCSSDTRKKHFQDQSEVGPARSNQDSWLTETRHQNINFVEFNDVRERNRGFNLPTCRASIPPLPPLKEASVREEAKEVPPLLKQASPIRPYNRNTPPPLKHKDTGSPHRLPISPTHLHSTQASVDADSAGLSPRVDPPSADSCLGAIPPISTLKRHFTSALALRGELDSNRSSSSIDIHSSSHLADSHSSAASNVGAFTTNIHSSSHKPPIVSHSSSGSQSMSTSADRLPYQDFNSFHSSDLHSSSAKEKTSSPGFQSVDLHPVNSLSPSRFHSAMAGWSKDKPARTDSTSRGCRNNTLSPPPAPADLHPVSAEGTSAGRDDFSGAICNNTSPPLSVSSTDSRTPSPPADSPSLSKTVSERLSPSAVSSVPTSRRFSPTDVHPHPTSPIHLHSSSAASEGQTDRKASCLVNHEEGSSLGRPPPTDLYCTNPVPPANVHPSGSVGALADEHLNHTALAASANQTSRRNSSFLSKPAVEPPLPADSKPCNHFDPSSDSQLDSKHNPPADSAPESQPPGDSHPKTPRRDFQLPTDNHNSSSPQSVENRWSSSSSADARSDSPAGSAWTAHTHSAT